MPMMHCPVCNELIADDAAFCPFCGHELRRRPQLEIVPAIKVGTTNVSTLSAVCFILGILGLVGGIIIARKAAIITETWGTYSLYTHEVFNWSIFLTTFLPYAISGVILILTADVIDKIYEIHAAIRKLCIVEKSNEEPDYPTEDDPDDDVNDTEAVDE